MQIRYELTLDDYVEACNALHVEKRRAANPGAFRRYFWISFILWSLLLCVFVIPRAVSAVRKNGIDLTATADEIAVISPWFALLAVQLAYTTMGRLTRRATQLWLILVAILGAALALFIMRFHSGQSVIPFQILFPWVFVGIMWRAYWTAFVGSRQHRTLWEGLSHEHGTQQLDRDASAFEISRPTARLRYLWPAMEGWIESANLFLIRISKDVFHMIPKRGFADKAAIDQFRTTLKDVMERRKPTGFTVVLRDGPAQNAVQPPPLPASVRPPTLNQEEDPHS